MRSKPTPQCGGAADCARARAHRPGQVRRHPDRARGGGGRGRGLARRRAGRRADLAPLSDGGPGLRRGSPRALGGERVAVPTVDRSAGRPPAECCSSTAATAYVEAPRPAGCTWSPPTGATRRDHHAYGVGELIAGRGRRRRRRVLVGLGGSATNDGGAGMLAALGAAPLDGPARCRRRRRAGATAGLDGAPGSAASRLVAASDVDNPLLGLNGASAVLRAAEGRRPRRRAAAGRRARALGRACWSPDRPDCEPRWPTRPAPVRPAASARPCSPLGGRVLSGHRHVTDLVGLDARGRGRPGDHGRGQPSTGSRCAARSSAGVAEAARGRGVPCLVVAGPGRGRPAGGRRGGRHRAYSLVEHFGRPGGDGPADAPRPDRAGARQLGGRWSG